MSTHSEVHNDGEFHIACEVLINNEYREHEANNVQAAINWIYTQLKEAN